MLTVKQLFQADGLNASEDQIKLVRHVGRKDRSIQQVSDASLQAPCREYQMTGLLSSCKPDPPGRAEAGCITNFFQTPSCGISAIPVLIKSVTVECGSDGEDIFGAFLRPEHA